MRTTFSLPLRSSSTSGRISRARVVVVESVLTRAAPTDIRKSVRSGRARAGALRTGVCYVMYARVLPTKMDTFIYGNELASNTREGKKHMEQKTTNGMMSVMLTVFLVIGVLVPIASVAMTGDMVGMTENETNDEATTFAFPGMALNYANFKLRGSGRMKRAVSEYNKKQLLELATELGVKGRHNMSKTALEAAIEEAQAFDDSKPPATGTGKIRRFNAEDVIVLPEQRAIEVRGKVHTVGHPNGDGLVIIDEDGNKHRVGYTNWTALAQVLERGLDGFYYEHWTPAGGKSAAVDTQNALLTQANAIPMEDRPTVRFVVITHTPDMQQLTEPKLFSVVTDTYTTIAAEDIYNELIEVMPPEQYQYTLQGNDGIHAGSIKLVVRDSDSRGIFNWSVTIDCGKFNGMQAIKVTGGMRVLFCSNQISIDVMQLARETGISIDIGGTSNMKRRHAGDLAGIIDQISTTVADGVNADGMVSTAMQHDLSFDDLRDVLDYYTDKRGLSQKLLDQIYELWDNEEVVQIPETLYGLGMVLTYIGTHDEDKSTGVASRLRTIGGELLAISPHWEQLFPAIQAGAATYRAKIDTSNKAKKPWRLEDSDGKPVTGGLFDETLVFKTDKKAMQHREANLDEESTYTIVYWGSLDEEGNQRGAVLASELEDNTEESEDEASNPTPDL